jgi:CheY-like chemotaxis protein
LVVEDNEDARLALGDLLEMLGHEVSLAADGPSGVQQAIDLRPDLCFIDVGLPGVDGYEVARRLRQDERSKNLYLIALTGYVAAEEAKAAGFDMYVLKPLDPRKLEGIVASGNKLA